MGFDIGVTLSAQIPIDIDEFVNAVLTLSPLREFEHPERGCVYALSSHDESWTREDIIEGWDVKNDGELLSLQDSGTYLVIGHLYRNFYKAGGTEDVHPNELDLNNYKEHMVSRLWRFQKGTFTGFDTTSSIFLPPLSQPQFSIPASTIPSLSGPPFSIPSLPLASLPVSPSLSRLQPPQPTVPVDLSPVEEEWPQIPKDESVETRTKARVYFENLIKEVKKITVWTMSVDIG